MAPPTPNLLSINCHDLGDWLGCYNRSYLNTPNIDSLAESGIQLVEHYSTAPICMPSRVSMYAGLYPHQAG